MAHPERERVKKALGIGEYPYKNDLADSRFVVKSYVYVAGVKCLVSHGDSGWYWLTSDAVPSLNVCGRTIDEAREHAAAAIFLQQNNATEAS
jgi:hypothetical protein